MSGLSGALLEVVKTPESVAGHAVRTIEEPVHYVVLSHHGGDVLLPLSLLRELAGLERGVDHLGHYGFSWVEKAALEEAGLATADLRGGMWPTGLLVSELLL